MVILTLPKTFKIGDTIDYPRNANEMVQITWRDAKTIVIEPDDARTVLFAGLVADPDAPEEILQLCATDKGVAPSEYSICILDTGDEDIAAIKVLDLDEAE
jgi:hypothetical protein